MLSEGKVAEQGTHSALLRQNGLYASLYRAQTGTASVNKDNVFKDEEMFAIEDDVGSYFISAQINPVVSKLRFEDPWRSFKGSTKHS